MAQEIKKTEAGSSAVSRYADPFTVMRAEMDRVLDSSLGRGRLSVLSKAHEGDGVLPSIDVRETGTEFVVEAELPGMEEKDFSVTLNNGLLTLKGVKKSGREENGDDYHLTERNFGSFERSFQVGDTVEANQVKAVFDKSVLKVTLPKRPEAAKAAKRIPIGKA